MSQPRDEDMEALAAAGAETSGARDEDVVGFTQPEADPEAIDGAAPTPGDLDSTVPAPRTLGETVVVDGDVTPTAPAPRTLGEAMGVVTAEVAMNFGDSHHEDARDANGVMPGQPDDDLVEAVPSDGGSLAGSAPSGSATTAEDGDHDAATASTAPGLTPAPAREPRYEQPSIDLWVVRPARSKAAPTAHTVGHSSTTDNETNRRDAVQESNKLSLDHRGAAETDSHHASLPDAAAAEGINRVTPDNEGTTSGDTSDSKADASTRPGDVDDANADQETSGSTQSLASNPLARTARSIVLSIDTSTRVCVGLAADGEVLAAQSTGTSRSHVELLMPTVRSVLAETGVTVHDLTGVVVGMGPGPYTGLRVGVAAAEMLGMTLGIPVRHVCSLDVIGLSWATTHPIRNYIACTDARRKELYWAVYDTFGRRLDGPNVSAPTELPKLPIVGPGTLLYPKAGGGMDTFLALRLGVRVDQIADEWPSLEDVSSILGLDPGLMAAWGEQLSEVGPEPLYLRHADATTPGVPKSVLPVVPPEPVVPESIPVVEPASVVEPVPEPEAPESANVDPSGPTSAIPPITRPSTPADLPAIMELETAAFTSGWSQESWAEEQGSHWVTVAVGPDNDIIGVIAMNALLDTAELLRIIVDPAARRAGLGRRLVEQGLAWAIEQGADQVFLEVSSGNVDAISLYEKCGFVPISRRERYYGPGDDAVVYRWSLADVELARPLADINPVEDRPSQSTATLIDIPVDDDPTPPLVEPDPPQPLMDGGSPLSTATADTTPISLVDMEEN